MTSQYLEVQRTRATQLLKTKSPVFYGDNGGGWFLGTHRDFVLQDAHKNIFELIREEVLLYFIKNGVSWWGGKSPTGHILSSQIACLNHLYAIRNDKDAVLGVLHTISSDFVDVYTIPTDTYAPAFIQFEAVSDHEHLNEGTSTRGSNCTSVDALIYAQHKDGSMWLIPIEWKYTESYNNLNKATEGSTKNPHSYKGKERQRRYTELINSSTQLQNTDHSCYYFEPFYQLMRQTLWAEQMVLQKTKETLQADSFLHVHVIPEENTDLLNKTYPCSGHDMESTWRNHLHNQKQYKIITPKNLMAHLNPKTYQDLLSYLEMRYWD